MLRDGAGRRFGPMNIERAAARLGGLVGGRGGMEVVALSDIDLDGTMARVQAVNDLRQQFRPVVLWPSSLMFPEIPVDDVKGNYDIVTASLAHVSARWEADLPYVPLPTATRMTDLETYGMGVRVNNLKQQVLATRYGTARAGSIGYAAIAGSFAELLVRLDMEHTIAGEVLDDIDNSGNALAMSTTNRWTNSAGTGMHAQVSAGKAAIRDGVGDQTIPDEAFTMIAMGTGVAAIRNSAEMKAQLAGRSGDSLAINVTEGAAAEFLQVGKVIFYPTGLPDNPWGTGNDVWLFVESSGAFLGFGLNFKLRGWATSIVPIDLMKSARINNSTVYGYIDAAEPAVTLPGAVFQFISPNTGT